LDKKKKEKQLIDSLKLETMKTDPNVLARNRFQGDQGRVMEFKKKLIKVTKDFKHHKYNLSANSTGTEKRF
jgi:hypothetical protein